MTFIESKAIQMDVFTSLKQRTSVNEFRHVALAGAVGGGVEDSSGMCRASVMSVFMCLIVASTSGRGVSRLLPFLPSLQSL